MASGVATASEGRPSKARVFLSYSRKDRAFVERLREALRARDYDAYIDLRDIAPGEDWRSRLDGLILSADAVVFVITDASLSSEVCGWEIDRTLDLGKRLIPFAHGPRTHAVPERLSALNYIFSDDPDGGLTAPEAAGAGALDKIGVALDVDITWVREHSRLTARAEEWEKADPALRQAKLLRRGEVQAAKAWMSLRPGPAAPSVPATLLTFLDASEALETADRERSA